MNVAVHAYVMVSCGRADVLVMLQRMEMPVASATEPAIVAGALAARVREGAEVCLSAIGVDAVGNAMRAICFARLYLEVQCYFSSCNAMCV